MTTTSSTSTTSSSTSTSPVTPLDEATIVLQLLQHKVPHLASMNGWKTASRSLTSSQTATRSTQQLFFVIKLLASDHIQDVTGVFVDMSEGDTGSSPTVCGLTVKKLKMSKSIDYFVDSGLSILSGLEVDGELARVSPLVDIVADGGKTWIKVIMTKGFRRKASDNKYNLCWDGDDNDENEDNDNDHLAPSAAYSTESLSPTTTTTSTTTTPQSQQPRNAIHMPSTSSWKSWPKLTYQSSLDEFERVLIVDVAQVLQNMARHFSPRPTIWFYFAAEEEDLEMVTKELLAQPKTSSGHDVKEMTSAVLSGLQRRHVVVREEVTPWANILSEFSMRSVFITSKRELFVDQTNLVLSPCHMEHLTLSSPMVMPQVAPSEPLGSEEADDSITAENADDVPLEIDDVVANAALANDGIMLNFDVSTLMDLISDITHAPENATPPPKRWRRYEFDRNRQQPLLQKIQQLLASVPKTRRFAISASYEYVRELAGTIATPSEIERISQLGDLYGIQVIAASPSPRFRALERIRRIVAKEREFGGKYHLSLVPQASLPGQAPIPPDRLCRYFCHPDRVCPNHCPRRWLPAWLLPIHIQVVGTSDKLRWTTATSNKRLQPAFRSMLTMLKCMIADALRTHSDPFGILQEFDMSLPPFCQASWPATPCSEFTEKGQEPGMPSTESFTHLSPETSLQRESEVDAFTRPLKFIVHNSNSVGAYKVLTEEEVQIVQAHRQFRKEHRKRLLSAYLPSST